MKSFKRAISYFSIIIIIWTIFGIVTQVESDITAGCVTRNYPVSQQILFFSISIVSLILSFCTKKKSIAGKFILFESIFWILRLLLYRGGYAVGVAPWTPFFTPIYDSIALFLRLFLLNRIFTCRSLGEILLRSIGFTAIIISLKFGLLISIIREIYFRINPL